MHAWCKVFKNAQLKMYREIKKMRWIYKFNHQITKQINENKRIRNTH
jgi:hypothetical protein